jgi:hypothetical protein
MKTMTERLRPAALSLASLCAVTLALASGACASARASDPQAERIAGICRNVMGTEDGTATFAACAQSLSSALDARNQAAQTVSAREACLAKGLARGSVALSECELNRPAALTTAAVLPADPLPPKPHGFVGVGNEEIRRREQRACAYVGLDPQGAAFDGCVASLAQGLFAADNPSQ